MKRISKDLIIAFLGASMAVFALSGCKGESSTVDNAYLSKLCSAAPFDMEAVTLPSIPDGTVNLKDFGAIGDGITLCTDAFAEAVKSLSDKGGGHLLVPPGIWFTGPIELKSNIDLHLDENAVILFSSDRNLYPIINTVFEGLDCRRCESPIHAEGAKNVSITGEGVIDGNGGDWRSVKKSKMNEAQWKAKVASGGILNEKGDRWYPDEGFIEAEKNADMNVPTGIETEEQWERIKSFLRPVMISFRECKNVHLEGVTFQNSPCWNIHPLMCKNVV
ncbi:MAG: glycoside hydrolase family 28 protein, partial [Bacteroidales bacterium]|nr:glycoside hydrolase family 28 protein [Bacteroidales bacterium]